MTILNSQIDGLDRAYKKVTSVFSPLVVQRLYAGFVSLLVTVLLVIILYNSPITGAIETETLRWRFETEHALTEKTRSQNIAVVEIKTSSPSDFVHGAILPSLLEKIEACHPAVLGIDLPIAGAPIELLKTLAKYPNIIVAFKHNSLDEPSLKSKDSERLPTFRRESGLYVEENGLVAHMPTVNEISAYSPSNVGFCEAIASRYRPSSEAVSKTAEEPIHFINYSNISFRTISGEQLQRGLFDPKVFENKIVLIGARDLSYVVPGPWPRTRKFERASEVNILAYAVQTLIEGSTIHASPKKLFTLFLYLLAIMSFLMPVCSHGIRTLIFLVALSALLFGSYAALVSAHVFVQIWPFLTGIVTCFAISTVAYSITDLNERNRQLRKTNTDLKEAQSELKKRGVEIARARELGMEEERKRIALDLHDDALKELFLASSAVEKHAGNGFSSAEAKQVQDKIHEASTKIRRIMANLSPSALNVCGLPGAIESLADIVRKDSSIEVSFADETNGDLDALDTNQALLLYRIVQEAFNNIEKHSQATKIAITLRMQNNKLLIAIADNGIGMNGHPAGSDAYGLNNMKYRAELIGAKVSWDKPEDLPAGTRVTVELIMPPNQLVS
jgi:signal transduction histidine kinase